MVNEADKPIPDPEDEPLGMREPNVLARSEHTKLAQLLEQHRASRAEELARRQDELSSAPRRLSAALNWIVQNDESIEHKREAAVFYIYVHRHPVTGTVFYVGKGVDSRAWAMSARRPEHMVRLYQLLKEGHQPGAWVSLVKWGLTEAEALRAEDQLIRELVTQGVDLVNRQKPIFRTERIVPSDVASEVRDRITSALAAVPDDQFYVSMWVLQRIVKLLPPKVTRAESIAQIREAFNLGVPGWYLDEDLYIRRGAQLDSA